LNAKEFLRHSNKKGVVNTTPRWGSTNIDLNGFEAGLYIYAIMQDNELVQKGKIIKN
jgi:hypothetical protein